MLAKLMKYEFKSTARLFIPLYAVLLVFALLNRFLNPFRTFEAAENFSLQVFVRGAGMAIYFSYTGSICHNPGFDHTRFYKNLLGDEDILCSRCR